MQFFSAVEVANYVSGPICGMILSDLGAEVIKIEPPEKGDPFRSWGTSGSSNPVFRSMNRNKKSLTLDLKKDEGKEVLLDLVKKADVIIENFRPSSADNLGLNYERFKAVNPRIIYCKITGFGRKGSYADSPAYDTIGQAMSGLLGLLTDFDNPSPVGISLADHLSGIFAAMGVLAAIYQREKTGKGQLVETSLLQSCAYLLGEHVAKYFYTGEVPTARSRVRNSQAFAFTAKDGKPFVIHLSSPVKFWNGLMATVNSRSVAENPLFKTYLSRQKNYEELNSALASIFKQSPRDHWLSKLTENDVPCAPINTLEELVTNPHVNEMNIIKAFGDKAEPMKTVAFPVNLSERAESPIAAAPGLGEHTNQVLERLGYTKDRIDLLRQGGVI